MYFRPRNKIYQIALYKNFNKACLVYLDRNYLHLKVLKSFDSDSM